ncbi:Hormonally up-regulated neu tumor-associated kinase homolog (Serine/threonine-protein kinase MAK-V) [Durusdinium trenchii]|uniref:Hormonally up-regulated neu tumor-associated kinase homolog (Serine/threonine-protein kinase MAK-V) n=1 Tax=Durusdinium trenchii TaxID=1381693 RepID=A0ABP0RMC9_9DINO
MPQSNGIARLIDVLEDSKAYYVVMERAGGCDLYECLSGAPERRLPAHEAREVLRELLAAVAELHSHGFIHKDLKLENVMLNRPGPKCPAHIRRNLATSQGAAVKLIDFDTVEEWNSTSPKSRHVLGTDQYIAPEAYEGKYSPASDIFAVGVIAYKMLTGSFPYNGRLFDDKPGENWVGSPKMKEIKQKLCDARVSFSHPVFEKEPGASRLVARMLAVEENERPDAPETTRSGVEEPVKHLKDQDIPDNTSFQWDITATVPTRAHPKTQECTGRFHEPGRFVMETLTAVGVALGGCFAFVKFKSQPKKGQELPQKMRRLVLREANSDISQARIEVEEVDLPQPRPGQVLIKVAASPVNPSDDGTWKVPPSQGYPMPLGNEGSGVVVATGGGLLASQWLGQSVAFLGKAYAEYAVADAFLLTTVPSDVTLEDAWHGLHPHGCSISTGADVGAVLPARRYGPCEFGPAEGAGGHLREAGCTVHSGHQRGDLGVQVASVNPTIEDLSCVRLYLWREHGEAALLVAPGLHGLGLWAFGGDFAKAGPRGLHLSTEEAGGVLAHDLAFWQPLAARPSPLATTDEDCHTSRRGFG